MAIVFAFSKEYFWLVWRLVDSLAHALAAAAATVLARRMAGVIAAATTMLMSYLDSSFQGAFVPNVMTEGMSTLAVMLLVCAASLVMERKRLVLVGFAGLVTGFLILTRHIFVFWLPMLLVMMIACWQWRSKGKLSQALAAAGLYLAVTLGSVAPWCVRNCIVLGKFMPLGTQGGWGLPLGYSDVAVEERGMAHTAAIQRIWESYSKVNDVTGLTPLEIERTQAEVGQREAIRWMRDHWAELPQLAFSKARTECKSWRPRHKLVIFGILMLGGLVTWRRNPQALVLLVMVVANTLTIMVTYSALGRFLVPVLFPCYILIGVGVAAWLDAIQSLDDYLSKIQT
jgi:hypothetical protein